MVGVGGPQPRVAEAVAVASAGIGKPAVVPQPRVAGVAAAASAEPAVVRTAAGRDQDGTEETC